MWSNKQPQIPDVNNSVTVQPDGQITCFSEEDKDRVLSFINTRRVRYGISDEEIEKEKEIVENLYSKGWVKIEKAFESKLDSIDEISNKLNYFLDGGDLPFDGCLGKQVGEQRTQGAFRSSTGALKYCLNQTESRKKELFLSIPEPLYNAPEIGDIIFDDRLVNIAKSFFRCAPVIGTLNLRKSFSNSLPSDGTTMYHIDPNSPYFFKAFVYLKDVESPEDGPFTYVEGSANKKPDNFLSKYRWPDEEIEDFYGKDKIKHLTAKKGDVVIAMTTGFHKGERCTRKERELLTIDYMCHPDSWDNKKQMSIREDTFLNLPLDKLPLTDFLHIRK